jgi:hypothetical protein
MRFANSIVLFLFLNGNIGFAFDMDSVPTADTVETLARFSFDKKLSDIFLNFHWESRNNDMVRLIFRPETSPPDQISIRFKDETFKTEVDGGCTHGFLFEIQTSVILYSEAYTNTYAKEKCMDFKKLGDTEWSKRRSKWVVPMDGSIVSTHLKIGFVLLNGPGAGWGMKNVWRSEYSDSLKTRHARFTAGEYLTPRIFSFGEAHLDVLEMRTDALLKSKIEWLFPSESHDYDNLGNRIEGTSKLQNSRSIYSVEANKEGAIQIEILQATGNKARFSNLLTLTQRVTSTASIFTIFIQYAMAYLPKTVEVN